MWEHSTHDRARGAFPVLTGTKMVSKIKENVQCRVVLIQTDKEKNERNQREFMRDFKNNNIQWSKETSGETIWHDTAKKLLQKR